MRKTVGIIFLLLAAGSIPVIAQQNFGSLSIGASLPQGDYASTGDIATSGYAKAGGAIKFDGAYFPTSYLGIGASFSFGSNYSMRDSMLRDVVSYIEENTPGGIDIPEDAEILYGSGFWNYFNLFIGPHFSIRASQKLYFDFRALAGLSVIRPPDQELTISYDGTSIYNRTDFTNVAFGWTAGTGIRIMLNPNLALKLSGDYVQTKSKNTYTFGLYEGIVDDIPPVDAEFYIRTVEVTVGLAYSF